MISPDTLAAALRVDQYAARRAMMAVRTALANDAENDPTLAEHDQAEHASGDPMQDAGAPSRRQREPS